jgi:predicted DNA-binding transcriptional regulator AlpA
VSQIMDQPGIGDIARASLPARISRPLAESERVRVPYVSLAAHKSGETIRKWHREGRMPRGSKSGRDWTWSREAIDSWVANGFQL